MLIHFVACLHQSLLRTICGLSYRGDVRMGFAEDPHKVGRIVHGSREALEEMYLPHLMRGGGGGGASEWGIAVTQVSEGAWQQDVSPATRLALMRRLPVAVLLGVSRRLGFLVPESHMRMAETREEILVKALASGDSTSLVQSSIKAIVRRSSL